MSSTFPIEELLTYHGYTILAGTDEAGVGALAGPVSAAVVVMPTKLRIEGLADSKRLSPQMRESLFSIITEKALEWQVAMVGAGEIDAVNIYQATMLAVERAYLGLRSPPQLLLTDGRIKPQIACNWLSLTGGDARSHTIASASILAKVSRDRLMMEMDRRFPGYDFASHKGYATKKHLERINQLGPSPIHRRSYAPVGKSYQSSAQALGHKGEDLACMYLLNMGYFVLARNYTRGGGEIDIIARDGATLIFAEVKTTRGAEKGEVAARADSVKRERMVLAVEEYLRENFSRPPECRFDLILVDLKPEKDGLFEEEGPSVTHYPGELRIEGD